MVLDFEIILPIEMNETENDTCVESKKKEKEKRKKSFKKRDQIEVTKMVVEGNVKIYKLSTLR